MSFIIWGADKNYHIKKIVHDYDGFQFDCMWARKMWINHDGCVQSCARDAYQQNSDDQMTWITSTEQHKAANIIWMWQTDDITSFINDLMIKSPKCSSHARQAKGKIKWALIVVKFVELSVSIKSKCGASVFSIKSIKLLAINVIFITEKSISSWHNKKYDSILNDTRINADKAFPYNEAPSKHHRNPFKHITAYLKCFCVTLLRWSACSNACRHAFSNVIDRYQLLLFSYAK